MREEEPLLDVRGEPCGMPALRVENFLRENRSRTPFSVLGDHLPTLEPLQFVAARYGWTVEFRQDENGLWRARFQTAG